MKNFRPFIVCVIAITFAFYSCNEKNEKHLDTSVANHAEYTNVKNAVLDYVEGIYQVDSTRIEKSIDTSLRKVGYWYNPNQKEWRDNLPMSYNQLVHLAATWNRNGKNANEQSPKEIVIFDINSKTATAKLTAEWGIDYFHLGKYNGQWKIMNVIWQSMPEK